MYMALNNRWGNEVAPVPERLRQQPHIGLSATSARANSTRHRRLPPITRTSSVTYIQPRREEVLRLPPGERPVVIRSDADLNALIAKLRGMPPSPDVVLVRFDGEFYKTEDGRIVLGTMQFALTATVYVVELASPHREDGVGAGAGDLLHLLLGRPDWKVVGFNVEEDRRVVRATFPGLFLPLDLIHDVGARFGGRGLSVVSGELLGGTLDKSLSDSEWGHPLVQKHHDYAALDAVLTRRLACMFMDDAGEGVGGG